MDFFFPFPVKERFIVATRSPLSIDFSPNRPDPREPAAIPLAEPWVKWLAFQSLPQKVTGGGARNGSEAGGEGPLAPREEGESLGGLALRPLPGRTPSGARRTSSRLQDSVAAASALSPGHWASRPERLRRRGRAPRPEGGVRTTHSSRAGAP